MLEELNAIEEAARSDSVGWIQSKKIRLYEDESFELELGGKLSPIDIEYETYGVLSEAKDNVVLIAHALSGDAHAAGWDKDASSKHRPWRRRKPGWWDKIIGPGKAIDTRKFYVICMNFIGSCYGSTGPSSINPATNKPFGLSFPMVTVGDWVKLEYALLQQMGISKIHAIIGGSLGGQQAIEFALRFPDKVKKSIVLAASPRLSAQGLAFNAVGRYCIMNDLNFDNGDYYGKKKPDTGLAAARMLAHITYLSDDSMHDKFGRRMKGKGNSRGSFGIEFEVESYLDYQGRTFVNRFDANSYLYITRAMDYYDAADQWGEGDLVKACSRIESEMIVVSFSSDWLYPSDECKQFALALMANGKPVTYIDVPSKYGHDSFLVETDSVTRLVKPFIERRI